MSFPGARGIPEDPTYLYTTQICQRPLKWEINEHHYRRASSASTVNHKIPSGPLSNAYFPPGSHLNLSRDEVTVTPHPSNAPYTTWTGEEWDDCEDHFAFPAELKGTSTRRSPYKNPNQDGDEDDDSEEEELDIILTGSVSIAALSL